MKNNYLKVTIGPHIEELISFNDADPISTSHAITRANSKAGILNSELSECQKAAGVKARIAAFTIPESAKDDRRWHKIGSTMPCPSWAHQWQHYSHGRMVGELCTRCGTTEHTSAVRRLQGLQKLVDEVEDGVPEKVELAETTEIGDTDHV